MPDRWVRNSSIKNGQTRLTDVSGHFSSRCHDITTHWWWCLGRAVRGLGGRLTGRLLRQRYPRLGKASVYSRQKGRPKEDCGVPAAGQLLTDVRPINMECHKEQRGNLSLAQAMSRTNGIFPLGPLHDAGLISPWPSYKT